MTRERLGFNPASLLGKSDIDASYECTVNGVFYHVVARDGKPTPKTEDVLPAKRVEVAVANGYVVGFAYDDKNFRPE
jgi:hypothetical protein